MIYIYTVYDSESGSDSPQVGLCCSDARCATSTVDARPLLKGDDLEVRRVISARVLVLALAVHSLLEGLSIGVLEKAQGEKMYVNDKR